MKYSNGPFKLVVDQTSPVHSFRIVTCEQEGYIDKEVARINPYNIDTREGDGILLAAAPEMFEALKMMQKLMTNFFCDKNIPWGQTSGIDFKLMNDALIMMDRAVAKVEGKLK